jgi:hypothetical protein
MHKALTTSARTVRSGPQSPPPAGSSFAGSPELKSATFPCAAASMTLRAVSGSPAKGRSDMVGTRLADRQRPRSFRHCLWLLKMGLRAQGSF